MHSLNESGTSVHLALAGKGGNIRCVFSSADEMRVGTGMTTRKHVSRIYWYVEQLSEDRFSLRRINSHHVPTGEERVIPLRELIEGYIPEVEFFEGNTVPAMELLQEYLDQGSEQREQGRLYSAQDSFGQALGMDEANVRALFNLGLIALSLHDQDKAREMMRELLKIKSTFSGRDQHLFNEFGIALRKAGMYDEAADYYAKGLEFVENDENLFYNLARVNYERGCWAECVEALGRSHALNPELTAARQLGELLVELANNDALREQYNKPPVPDDVAARLVAFIRSRTTAPAQPAIASGPNREALPAPAEVQPAAEEEQGANGCPEAGRVRTGSGAARDELKFDI
ncbi:tetratricopeptide repeat protein [Pseudodesulfovibrio sp. F-1]|uniref:Tetratricopeptide repeat protein n=1 Tax=Pseudodesulfovibrio alkaliphilus TaxID=2661613 RepID=A0A7K1KKQ8_9BACT|nr:tetratricopeptide repeat protein [Pseudodesulfovibrio alkaliphilus]MUM76597.1 tetratricopeptide repeat protein [Pseudodesulfovibrio alkaliphilus]